MNARVVILCLFNQLINQSSLIQTYEVHRTTQLQMYNKNDKRKKIKNTTTHVWLRTTEQFYYST